MKVFVLLMPSDTGDDFSRLAAEGVFATREEAVERANQVWSIRYGEIYEAEIGGECNYLRLDDRGDPMPEPVPVPHSTGGTPPPEHANCRCIGNESIWDYIGFTP
jgi:hypothetical protein